MEECFSRFLNCANGTKLCNDEKHFRLVEALLSRKLELFDAFFASFFDNFYGPKYLALPKLTLKNLVFVVKSLCITDYYTLQRYYITRG